MEAKDILIVEDVERVRRISKESHDKIFEEIYTRTLDKLRELVLEAAKDGRFYVRYDFESATEQLAGERLEKYFKDLGYECEFDSDSDAFFIHWLIEE